MSELRKNEKILIGVVLALSFAFAFNLLILKPLHEKLSFVDDEISREELVFRRYSGLEKKKDSLQAVYKKIEPYLGFKGSDNEKTAAILSSVEAEARKAGLVIVDMKPIEGTPGRSGTASIYRVQMTAEADMAKVTEFLYGLGNAAILFNVEKLSVATKDESTGVMKMEAVIAAICLA